MNEYLMMAQYILFMMIFKLFFMIVSCALIPVAYIIGIVDKMKTLSTQKDPKSKVINNFIFIPLGIPILLFDTFADAMYFWKNNFRSFEQL